jgi:hypothetical protein
METHESAELQKQLPFGFTYFENGGRRALLISKEIMAKVRMGGQKGYGGDLRVSRDIFESVFDGMQPAWGEKRTDGSYAIELPHDASIENIIEFAEKVKDATT